MTSNAIEMVGALHDATVREFHLFNNENGERALRMRLRCDADCGYDAWNGKTIEVLFVDPLIVHGELFGHRWGDDSFDSWGPASSNRLIYQLGRMKDIGIPTPVHLVELLFHSGSIFEVACNEIRIDIV
jgi:hypothetical protein